MVGEDGVEPEPYPEPESGGAVKPESELGGAVETILESPPPPQADKAATKQASAIA
jgi:hypothetical protein